MNIIPVIFEDHRLSRFRPLTWSTPVFEIRCGMFNTRERVDLCSGGRGGVLLGRDMLRNLNRASAWEWGATALEKLGGPDQRYLFLNGLLAPDFSLVQNMFGLTEKLSSFVWKNEEGLVAALLDQKAALRLAADWGDWEGNHDRQGAWSDSSSTPAPWTPAISLPEATVLGLEGGGEVHLTGTVDPSEQFTSLAKSQAAGPGWIWNIVHATGSAINGDLSYMASGQPYRREPFGISLPGDQAHPDWTRESALQPLGAVFPSDMLQRWDVDDPDQIYCGSGVEFAVGTAFNTSSGPIVVDRGVRVMPHCYLEGPLYIGPGSLVKPGARLHGHSSFGIVNRIAGEIGESTFGDFANKQHAGFIGHAVLGAWINLGALTTCSDLKNNYGEIRVDLGWGPVATGSQFVGLMMGDHAKTAIGTMFNTGTSVGFASNIFGGAMPPKFVGNFKWGGQVEDPDYAVDRAQSTTNIVMPRRGCRFTSAHAELFKKLGG